jgi:hypothetical protein
LKCASAAAAFFQEGIMSTYRGKPIRGILAASIGFAFAAAGAHAETGSGAAHDVAIHIDVLGVAGLDVDPQASVAFDNAIEPAYQQDALPSLDLGGALIHVSTGATESEAQYEPGSSLSWSAADTTIHNFNLSAVNLLGDGLISISADLIQSQSSVIGYCLPSRQGTRAALDDINFFNGFDNGNLTPGGPGDGGGDGGNVVLVNPEVTILGIPIPALPTAPAPNTTIDLAPLGIAGATLILNERTIGGDGVDMSSMTSNAMHLTLSSAGLITADVALGHSEAKLDCTN